MNIFLILDLFSEWLSLQGEPFLFDLTVHECEWEPYLQLLQPELIQHLTLFIIAIFRRTLEHLLKLKLRQRPLVPILQLSVAIFYFLLQCVNELILHQMQFDLTAQFAVFIFSTLTFMATERQSQQFVSGVAQLKTEYYTLSSFLLSKVNWLLTCLLAFETIYFIISRAVVQGVTIC